MKSFEFIPYSGTDASVAAMIHEDGEKRPSIIFCPGSGYVMTWTKNECKPLAQTYFDAGYNTFILFYSTADKCKDFNPLKEISSTIISVRENSDEWNCRENAVAVAGFSSGGHVAGCSGILWNDPRFLKYFDNKGGLNKPDALVLGFPTISSANTDINDYIKLISVTGESYDMDELFALDTKITSETPPIFVWTSTKDVITPPLNTLSLATALQNAGVYYEAHFFPTGGHGLPLALEDKVCKQWVNLSIMFLDTLFEI